MSYMAQHFDLRIDPRKLFPPAKSVIVLAYNYYQQHIRKSDDHPKISVYAYGRDYHRVVKKKCKELIAWLKSEIGDVQARAYVDSAPIMEREWARRSGIAWSGKNTLSIHPRRGSYFFLACILTDIEFDYDHPIKDFCGTCNRCIEACPTEALHPQGYFLDASKCISYLTIEHKGSIDSSFDGQMQDWIFGCDICQQVCPWNRFSEKTSESAFEPVAGLLDLTIADWQELDAVAFNNQFKGTPLMRTKIEGMRRNAAFLRPSTRNIGNS